MLTSINEGTPVNHSLRCQGLTIDATLIWFVALSCNDVYRKFVASFPFVMSVFGHTAKTHHKTAVRRCRRKASRHVLLASACHDHANGVVCGFGVFDDRFLFLTFNVRHANSGSASARMIAADLFEISMQRHLHVLHMSAFM